MNKVALSFIWKRIQSISGFFFIFFLLEHLFVNSQVAFLGEKNTTFIQLVGYLQSIPHLNLIEITLIALPLLIHTYGGTLAILKSSNTCKKTDGTTPSLAKYNRNKAYILQRITAMILIGIILWHVIQMRFLNHPVKINYNSHTLYFVNVEKDNKLSSLLERFKAKILDDKTLKETGQSVALSKNRIIVATPLPGQAFFLILRDTFKKPVMIFLYMLLVLAAAFHASNGLWSFLISWGILLSYKVQKLMITISSGLIALLVILGFSAIWGTFMATL